MSETEGAAGSAAYVAPLAPLGRWPVINLIVMEEEDFAHGFLTAEDEGGRERISESSERGSTVRAARHVLRIHMDIPLRNPTLYNDIRNALALGDRPRAHQILMNSGHLNNGTQKARDMVEAALRR